MRLERGGVVGADGGSFEAHLHGEVEHGPLTFGDVGLAIVDRHLIGDQWILGPDPQDGAV